MSEVQSHGVPAAVIKSIAAGNKAFADAIRAHDSKALSMVYTSDGQLMPTGAPVQHGREAVAAVFQSVMDSGVVDVDLVTEELGPMGAPGVTPEMVYERGLYTLKTATGIADAGKYIVLWKCVGGKWFYYIDIFNTNSPAK